MKTYKELANEIGGNLESRAIGDGSISFTWLRQSYSMGVRVTPAHINLWRKEFQKFTKMEILNKKSSAVLFLPVTRIDENTLDMSGRSYTYKKDDKFTAEIRYLVSYQGEESTPLHHSNGYALFINFYLKNEKEIVRQGLY